MSDREFAVIATRLIWGETEAEPTPQDTIKRLKALLETRDLYLSPLKDLSEALLRSTGWAEQDAELAKALLWGLHALQEQQELSFVRAHTVQPSSAPPPQA